MDPIEKAIRTALEKGNADEEQFRERVYRSVEAALDRAIQANPQLTVEKAIGRRRALQAKIREIESEYQIASSAEDAALDATLFDLLAEGQAAAPAVDAAVIPEPEAAPAIDDAPARFAAPSVSAPAAMAVEHDVAPSVSVDDAAPRGQPALDVVAVRADERGGRVEATRMAQTPPVAAGTNDPRDVMSEIDVLRRAAGMDDASVDFPSVIPPGIDEPARAPVEGSPPEIVASDRAARREKRRPFAAAFLGIAILSLLAVGLLFAFQTGLLKSPAGRDTGAHTQTNLPSEDVDPGQGGTPALTEKPQTDQKWITIFTPANPTTVGTPADAKAEMMKDDDGGFLRITSGSSGSAVTFDVGPGVLQQLVGRKAVFNVSARGANGQGTEISIECNFGDLGSCGRKRYEIGYDKAELLFDVQMPNKDAGADGTIAINSDFAGKGRALDIFEIRVSAQ